ncbi:IS3 family transposase [Bengtsoniella intestinalis]|uniref:IS3 family transposase n=1 Tax=Bengtsoniella intestinalis TaxID=3073143 RepID=UPI00391F8EA0
MAKYSFEFKKQVIMAYENQEGGYESLAKKYGIPSLTTVKTWHKSYKEFGDDGLVRSRENKSYPFDFKLSVVELYLTTEISYQELALKMGINNPSLITRWVNDFRIAGPAALQEKSKVRRPKMAKPEKIDHTDDHGAYLKQLEDENLKLRIEVAYLKELRRLRLEEEAQNKEQEVSATSGDLFQLKDILAVLKFPKATYMYWQKRFDKENPDKEIEEKILEIRDEHKDFGYRRILGELRKAGWHVNKKKVQRLVQKLGLQVKSYTRKSRKYSSYKGIVGRICKNWVKRRFNTNIVHQKITTDTTEFKYYTFDSNGKLITKKLYLDPFLDMFNGEILSYSITKTPSAEGIMAALNEAIEVTNDCKFRRTFHSDRGWAYQMKRYSRTLKENRIFQSMSRKGNCLDNSVMENFFGLLKQEIYYGNTFYSFDELKLAIENFIDYYNNKRTKQKLGYFSPVEYRLKYLAA